jgi:redox-sensing transcriptional repressor
VSKDEGAKRAAIPELTTRRLSVYLRCLQDLEEAGVETVSSREMAEQFHLNSAQFRKDLAYFGEFGVRGLGYRVADLKSHLVRILGLDRQIRLAILGAGKLGLALADYGGFNSANFQIVALFDTDPAKVGQATSRGIPIRPLDRLAETVAAQGVEIAVLAVPSAVAQAVLDQAAAAGIPAVLNFVPAPLKAPEGVRMNTVDLKVQMEALVFHLTREVAGDSPGL